MIVNAVSIHSGGGKVLLDHLLIDHTFGPVTHLLCDSRYELPANIDPKILVFRIKPKLIDRWKAEFLLKEIAKNTPQEEVFCFSNLPPAFNLKNKVILYLQNALLLPSIPLYAETPKAKLRILYEKTWLRIFWNNIDEVWVQTEWMKESLSQRNKLVLIKPFLPKFPAFEKNEILFEFISVTGSAPHKRLLHLLNAWDELKDPPTLLVVMDTPSKIIKDKIKILKCKNIKIKINISREELFSIYPKCSKLIVTSRLESFCLPIYEARHFGLQVFAIKEFFTNNILENHNVIAFEQNKIILDGIITKK